MKSPRGETSEGKSPSGGNFREGKNRGGTQGWKLQGGKVSVTEISYDILRHTFVCQLGHKFYSATVIFRDILSVDIDI